MLFYFDRLELLAHAAKLARSFQDYARHQIHVGPSGLFSQRYLRWATEVVGIDRILFSTDHPFGDHDPAKVRANLADATLSDEDREKVAGGNWDRLVTAILR